jgi:hypothetical protein
MRTPLPGAYPYVDYRDILSSIRWHGQIYKEKALFAAILNLKKGHDVRE